MTEYRFLAYDLRTNVALGELPLSVKTFGETLGGGGEFSASLPLENDLVAPVFSAATVPEKTVIYVERDGVLLQGYVLWRRTRALERPVELWGSTLPSLFRRQRIISDLSYAAVDQLTIGRALVTHVQSQTGADFGINVGTGTSGVTRTLAYNGYERKNAGDALDELSRLDGGFDWSVDVTWSGGVPAKNLTLSYPRRGRGAGATGVVFEAGKNLLDYSFVEDGTRSARTVDVLGAGDGKDMLIATATETALLDTGYPLTAEVIARKDEAISVNIAAIAVAEVRARAATPTFLTVQVSPDDVDAGLGTWTVGDDVLVRITDQNFPLNADETPGYERYHRVISYEVNIPEAGPESVTVTLGSVN